MAELEDDASILNDEVLWRRIWPDWIAWEEGADGKARPKSVAFQDRRDGKVSASIARETTKYKLLRCYPEHSLVSIPAGLPRGFGCKVARRPTREDPAHVVIFPSPSKPNARKLAQSADWVVLRDTRQKWDSAIVKVLGAWKRISVSLGFPCPTHRIDTTNNSHAQ